MPSSVLRCVSPPGSPEVVVPDIRRNRRRPCLGFTGPQRACSPRLYSPPDLLRKYVDFWGRVVLLKTEHPAVDIDIHKHRVCMCGTPTAGFFICLEKRNPNLLTCFQFVSVDILDLKYVAYCTLWPSLCKVIYNYGHKHL